MKIIDAHLHFCKEDYFDEIALAAGHENTAQHLAQEYRRLGIVHGVIMGNKSLEPTEHNYPDFLSYCIGLDTLGEERPMEKQVALVEENLKRRHQALSRIQTFLHLRENARAVLRTGGKVRQARCHPYGAYGVS